MQWSMERIIARSVIHWLKEQITKNMRTDLMTAKRLTAQTANQITADKPCDYPPFSRFYFLSHTADFFLSNSQHYEVSEPQI